MKKIISLMLVLSVAFSALALSGCDGDKREENGQNTSSSSTKSSKTSQKKKEEEKPMEVSVDEKKPRINHDQLSELNKKILAAQETPKFTCTSETIDAASISKGKTLTFIPKNSDESYCKRLTSTFKLAAGSAGFDPKNVKIESTDGSVSSLSEALAKSVENKSDVSILAGNINKDDIEGAIETTQANGIEVFSAGSKGLAQNDHYVDYTVPINYQRAGELMADWGIVKSNAKVNALAINCTDSEISETVFTGFKAEFEKYVSAENGYCTTLNVKTKDIGNSLTDSIKNALKSDSNINFVFVFDESAIPDVVLAASQMNNKLRIIAAGSSVEAFEAVEAGNIQMLVASSYEWTAYAIVDYVLRVFGGLTLPVEQDVPLKIVTKEIIQKDIKSYDGPSYDGYHEICFGSDFVPGYSGLWNK